MPAAESDPATLAIYVHWPFCATICPYCDFNVHRDRGADAVAWSVALGAELRYWAGLTPGRRIETLYFGGGTPSLAPTTVIEGVIKAAEDLWGFADDPEISLEANPADAGRFAAFRAAGVNRLSLGVQSLDGAALKFLGRDHDAKAARKAIEAALDLFPRVSADLIYALPGQTVGQWTDQLKAAIRTGVQHLSLYQLTIEPGTAYDIQVAKGRWTPADDRACADLFDAAQELTSAAGLPAYEISNHARAGHRCRHNETYWRQGDYVAIGPGAHGRVTVNGVRRASETARAPGDYLARVNRDGHALTIDEALTDAEIRIEKFAMGLRMTDGVLATPADLAALGAAIAALEEDGFLIRDGARIGATADGRRLLNAVLERLFA